MAMGRLLELMGLLMVSRTMGAVEEMQRQGARAEYREHIRLQGALGLGPDQGETAGAPQCPVWVATCPGTPVRRGPSREECKAADLAQAQLWRAARARRLGLGLGRAASGARLEPYL